jgi:hypothetical protein
LSRTQLEFRAHQTRWNGRLLCLGFNEITQFLSKSEVLVALFNSVFFSPIIILFLQYSHKMFLKFDPYRVWCSIFYSKLVNCILFKIIVQHVRFVKCRWTFGSGERNVKIWIDFRKSPRFSLTSPLSQERERSQVALFLLCVVSPGIMFIGCTTFPISWPINILLSVGTSENTI